MPYPNKGEKRGDYISRCVREVRHEDPKKPIKECLGKCYGMWRQKKPGDSSTEKEKGGT